MTTAAQAKGTAFHDALTQSVTPHEGPTATFTTNFADPLQEKIDYIFLHTGKDAATTFTVQRHAILADQQNGCYPSDHLPVLTDLIVSIEPLQEDQ